MQILFITRKFPPQIGGMEKHLYNLVKYFPGPKEVIKLTRPQYHLFWFIPYSIIIGLIKARKADWVCISDPLMALTGWIIKKILHKPIVCILYGLDLTYPNPLYQTYLKLFAKNFDQYICISRATEKIARTRGINQTQVIPVGIEPARSLPLPKHKLKKAKKKFLNQLGIQPKSKKNSQILLTVGRLIKRKGVYWFIDQVMPALKNCIYLIVGDGIEKKRIKNLIKEKNLQNKVLLLGKVSNQKLKEIYSLSNVFVMPNIKVKGDMEGFGIVALEAGLYKLPTVASNIEGIKDAVSNHQNGILVPPQNKKEFIKAIKKLLQNKKLRQKFGEQAKKFVINNFAWEKTAQRYKKILQEKIPRL